ncbi:cupin domain-containing protein [Saliphagus sp. GCM10025317]
MADSENSIAHSDLSDSTIDAEDLREAGDGTRIYHESATGEMDSQHDGRSKHILINKGLVPDAGDLLVDVVTYGPEVACPEHYHEGTDHFFYILEGDGVLEVEGEEHDIEAGTVAWIGEGDRHRLFARKGQQMTVFEYFSNGDHDTTFFGEECTWKPESAD